MIRKSGIRFSDKIMLNQILAQQAMDRQIQNRGTMAPDWAADVR